MDRKRYASSKHKKMGEAKYNRRQNILQDKVYYERQRGNFIMADIKENITIPNIHVITELQHIQVKIDREIDKSTLIARDFNTLLGII